MRAKMWAKTWVIVLFIILGVLILLIVGPLVLSVFGISLVDNNDLVSWVGIAKSYIEMIAVIVAGYWAYDRFIKARADIPYPKLEHRIEHCRLQNNNFFLSVFVTAINEENRMLDISDGMSIIRQVSPIAEEVSGRLINSDIRTGSDASIFIDSGQRLKLDTLGVRKWGKLRESMRKLDPGQAREMQFVFLVDGDADVIEVISYFGTEDEKIGPEHTTIYFLKPKK